jgi:heat shock protein HslJ
MTIKTQLTENILTRKVKKLLFTGIIGAITLGLSSCASIFEPCSCSSPPLADLNGTWELSRWNLPPENGQVRLRNIPHGDNGEPLKMVFDLANKRLSGFSGCNNFMAGVTDDPKGIVIGAIASTRKMCGQDRMNQIETDFLYQLKDYRSFQLNQNTLLLIGRDGDVLAFGKRK